MRRNYVLVLLSLCCALLMAPAGRAALTTPTSNQVFTLGTTAVAFGWEPVAGATSYKLKVLFNGAAFDSASGITGTAVTLTNTYASGHYSVQVRDVTGGTAGPWSDPVPFLVRRAMVPTYGAVVTTAPASFKWTRSATATRYLFKLSRYDRKTGKYAVLQTLWIPQPAYGMPRWSPPAGGIRLGKYRWSVTDYAGVTPGTTSTANFQFVVPGDTYLVIDLSGGTNALYYPVTYLKAVPAGGWTDDYKTEKLVLRKVPAGAFTMGSPYTELGRQWDEMQHKVTLTTDFYLGLFEVTQRQWELVMGNRPSYFTNRSAYASRPVEQVSYYDVRGTTTTNADAVTADWPVNSSVGTLSFMGKLRARTGLDNCDLPTEAQWEYACRAGTTTALNNGKNLTNLYSCVSMNKLGRYWFNGGDGYRQEDDATLATAKAGSYLPNAWGLYDMHGNVLEWCLDWYGTYPGTIRDPAGATVGSARVLRGGSWYYGFAQDCRSASRFYGRTLRTHYIGFRLASGTLLTQSGALRVDLSPPGAVSTGAQWAVDGGPWQNSGTALPGLSIGVHGLTFKTINGYTSPEDQAVTISNAITTIASGMYMKDDPEAFLVVDLSGGTATNHFPVTYLGNVPKGGWTEEYRTTKLVLRKIPAGLFPMGSPTKELGRLANEARHTVTLTKEFHMGVFEVTQRQWELVVGNRPSYFNNNALYASRPVEQVSYYDIREDAANEDDPFVNWPSNRAVNAASFMGLLRGKTGLDTFDLPTEAQWEYACRAGTTTALNSGTNLTDLVSCPPMDLVGRYWSNGGSGYRQSDDTSVATATVGVYLPNAWGLYDMHGNVLEWCLDGYGNYSGLSTDPPGAASGATRVLRGGSWSCDAQHSRSACRDFDVPSNRDVNFGFRVVSTQP